MRKKPGGGRDPPDGESRVEKIDRKTIEMKVVVVVVMVKEKRMEETREERRERQEGRRRCGWFARATLLCTVSSIQRTGQDRTGQNRTGWSSSC